jgi:regulator of protease activity HflC (stomatin/prohibitin superfamily)
VKYVVNAYEIGLLFKDKSFIKVLHSGTYRFMPFSKKWVLPVDMTGKFEPGYDLSLFLEDNELTEMLDIINLRDNEIALHYVEGNFCEVLDSGRHACFNTLKKHSFVVLNTNNPFLSEDIDLNIFKKDYFKKEGTRYFSVFTVPMGRVGILTLNGDFVKTLSPGTHYFLKGMNTIEVRTVDLRKKVIEVPGQELLSEDKVTLRMNFICQYRIIDAVKVAMEFEEFEQQLYITLQLALREYVATRKLDELLAQKHEIGDIILNVVRPKQEQFGIKLMEAGVKDIILPGDIKEILNTVLIAEKRAYANVITRREETASTRSLLNTAKLMEENKTLYRLKELEYLEKICDKVGNISLSANSGILDQLRDIVKIDR